MKKILVFIVIQLALVAVAAEKAQKSKSTADVIVSIKEARIRCAADIKNKTPEDLKKCIDQKIKSNWHPTRK